jgi:Gpi18-like mannosyltransferase
MELFYTIITNPFFWALISIFGLLGASTVVSNARASSSRALAALSGLFFTIGRLMLVLPVCPHNHGLPLKAGTGWRAG